MQNYLYIFFWGGRGEISLKPYFNKNEAHTIIYMNHFEITPDYMKNETNQKTGKYVFCIPLSNTDRSSIDLFAEIL